MRATIFCLLLGLLMATPGCGSGTRAKQQNREFFTSGSTEADQRASQRMAKAEQLAGSGEGAGEKEKQILSGSGGSAGGTNTVVKATQKKALFDRLGGAQGLEALVDDFTQRVLQDPRVNWERYGETQGGFSLHRTRSVAWQPTPANVEKLKKHLVQFLALATGGPAHYEGKEMKGVHADMHISNPEFDAAIGDLKATLDKLQIANQEQKELLSIVESTRPEIVTER